ncbi:cytochrome c maturation protein CcmE [Deinococcus puniceus]|uniref:Cytochrome c-type biogenesis protein CcmE n=1 Tax=Deinococcus puniceus TaxID=1182568 RepID=A0A172TAD3_9DEIO|nr:cytochrome c maturation protein CcmE [Deinococcus puniceus]ANE43904.1 cytochrome C biogenesis protein CcmE [Deinococcus puniceus]
MTMPSSPPPSSPLPPARRRKRSPLPVALGVVALVGLTAFIAFGNLGKSLEYFVTPSEYLQQRDELEGRPIRIGGLVKAVQYNPQTLDLKFNVSDGGASFPVTYNGAVSDLFKEDQGVVVRGQFSGNTFEARELVVKHSEEYNVPKTQAELKDLLQRSE